ncbi:MAG TPA: hypothetical protein VMZ06_10185 [Candidatus Bathyarchaeia archaeon]|nr:hypothetical protein [Candidatus Bathyarchaeia archaeon]
MKGYRPQVLLSRVETFFETYTVSGHVLFLLAVAALMLQACNGNTFWQKPAPPAAPLEPAPAGQPYTAPIVGQPGLPLSPDQRFKDVPLPQGAKPDLERTFVYESPALHVGRMVYTSRAGLTDLAQFYIREAPTGQWQLQDTIEAEKSVTLLFNKTGSRMVVQVQDLGIAKGRRLMITITPDSGSGGGL